MSRITRIVVTYEDGEETVLTAPPPIVDLPDGSRQCMNCENVSKDTPAPSRSRTRANKIGDPEAEHGPTEEQVAAAVDAAEAAVSRRRRPTPAAAESTAGDSGSTAPTSGRTRPSSASYAPSGGAPTTLMTGSTGRRPRPTNTGAATDAAKSDAPSAVAPSSETAQMGRRPRPTSAGTAQPAEAPRAKGDLASPTTISTSRTRQPSATASAASGTTISHSDKVSDADVSKACSHAAQRVGPKEVMKVMQAFGASAANEVPAGKRRAFIDALASLK